ncbi:hypothetical protein ACFU5Y_04335 [Streptomyces gardneri]|uniref:hypothetical protein n=1 Tax=Streptomyces gardneri TaxID=66892 RepID=UPI003690CA28
MPQHQPRTDAQLLDLATRIGMVGMATSKDIARRLVKAGLSEDEMRRVLPLLEQSNRR